jgi:hypothetical protein
MVRLIYLNMNKSERCIPTLSHKSTPFILENGLGNKATFIRLITSRNQVFLVERKLRPTRNKIPRTKRIPTMPAKTVESAVSPKTGMV